MWCLKREIEDLKINIKIKQEKLLGSRMEIQDLEQKLKQSLKQIDENLEKDMVKENNDLKRQIDILEQEKKALKIKLDKNSDNKHHDKEKKINMATKHSCERCCLNFLSKEKLDKR